LRKTSVLILALVLACGDESTSTDNPDDPDDPGPGNALVRLNIRGVTGLERAMEVRYAIADAPITRAAESVIPRPAPISYCITVLATGTCDIIVPIGKSLSLYAYEGFDGAFKVVAPMNGFTLEGNMHEFVVFTGECLQAQGFLPGDCSVTPTVSRTYVVGADFSIMPTFRVYSTGKTGAEGPITARDVRGMPVRENIFSEGGTGGSSNTETLIGEGAFAVGTEITLFASLFINQAMFIRWEGCKTGTGGTQLNCTLPSSTPGAAPATVRIFGEYWQCAQGIADGPGTGCNKIRP